MLVVNKAPDDRLPIIEPLAFDHLPELLKLSQEQAWTHTERDWKVMLATGQTYGHLLVEDRRQLLSCIHVTDYGASLATLGMLIVAKRHRKRGLATSLVNHVLGKHHQSPMGLVAASQAQSFYPPFGFASTGEHVVKLTRTGGYSMDDETPTILDKFPLTTTSVSKHDAKRAIIFDRQATHLDRSHLLDELLSTSDRAFVVQNESQDGDDKNAPPPILGYGLAKFQPASDNSHLLNVGPVVATDTLTALALCYRLTQHHEGPIRLDIFSSQQELIDYLKTALGFHPEGKRQAVMLRQTMTTTAAATTSGVNEDPDTKLWLPGNRSVMFCPASQAWL